MRTDTDARSISTRYGVGPRIAAFQQCRHEFVDQMRMRTAMAPSRHKRQVLGIVNLGGQREFTNRFRQQMRVVRHLDLFRNLRLRFLGGMSNVGLIFPNQHNFEYRIFDRPLTAMSVEPS